MERSNLTLAVQAGIKVPATQVVRLSGSHPVAIRRFDRKVDGGRIHSVLVGMAILAVTVA